MLNSCRLASSLHHSPSCSSSTVHAYAAGRICSQKRSRTRACSATLSALQHTAMSAPCNRLHINRATDQKMSAFRESTGGHATQLSEPASSTPAAAAAVDLELWTQDGTTHSMCVSPGTTTAGDLRRMAAEKTGLPVGEVRLAYAGLELALSSDGTMFTAKPGVTKLFTMRRAAAGAPDADSPTDNAARNGSTGEGPTAAAATEEPPHRSLPTEVTVLTVDGKMLKVPLKGSTTAGDIRKAVAATIGAGASEVRLAYAGKELDHSQDNTPFKLNPRLTTLQSMMRMKGGFRTTSNASPSTTADLPATEPAAGTRRGRPKTSRLRQHARIDQPLSKAAVTGAVVVPAAPAAAVVAPGAGVGGSAKVQLAKQFRHIMRHPIPGVSVAPDESDEMTWHVKLAGPDNTPYAGGWFSVQLHFDSGFPGSKPNVRFMTPIWHPNVSRDGSGVCVDFGRDVRSVACVLSGLQMLLAHPNPDSPVNHDCARDMRNNLSAYVAEARSLTAQYAM